MPDLDEQPKALSPLAIRKVFVNEYCRDAKKAAFFHAEIERISKTFLIT
jgi:hypothetical protein